MGYDRGDSFPFVFEPNRISFGSKSKGKLSPRSYPIQCEREWKHCFLSVVEALTHLKNGLKLWELKQIRGNIIPRSIISEFPEFCSWCKCFIAIIYFLEQLFEAFPNKSWSLLNFFEAFTIRLQSMRVSEVNEVNEVLININL